MSTPQPAVVVDAWTVYDSYVRGAMPDELAIVAGKTLKQVTADIAGMRSRMQARYAGITDLEADELRAIHIMLRDGRKLKDASALRIVADLSLRQRDIVNAAAVRDRSRAARAQERYQ